VSLFSRLFRKAQPSVSVPENPPEPVAQPAPEPSISVSAAAVADQEEEALKAAIEQRDTGTIANLAIKGSSTKIRQLAAEAIEDPAQIRELIKAARGGNDKSVYKILARKRDALLAQERHREQLHAEINAVALALERHSQRHYDPLFMPTLEQLENRWKAVAAHAEPDVVRKTQDAIDQSRELIAQHLRQIAAQASRELAEANAAAEAQRQREQEQKAAAAAAAERAQILEAERKAQAEKQEAEAQALRQISGLLRKAFGALNDGGTGRAAGLRRSIEEKLPGAPPLPAYLTNQLQRLDAKLNELKDWKSFSVTPKRSELLEAIEALAAGSTLEPPALAERIKSLQEDWRTLSKGAGDSFEADWQRFQDAAQKAYQPCREYFAAQALVRQENLQRREALLARLTAFEAQHNWEQPDWRAVMRALRESKQEWRQHTPVDREAGKPLQEQFRALTASIQSRLDAEHTRNIKEKKILIEAAQRLLAAEDTRKAFDDMKALQQRWKSVGPVPRDQDQPLWEEFRQHCDALLQKRQQKFAEHAAGLEANKSAALEICATLERIAALPGREVLENAKQLSDIRSAFEAVGELPKDAVREVRNRFERALRQCDAALARQQSSEVQERWTALFEASNYVRAYRLARAQDAGLPEQERLQQAAENYIAAVTKWPKRGLEALRSALAKTGDTDFAANELALRTLCIRAEILTDTATPPSDHTLRREYQIQHLIENMGQGITTDERQLDALAIEWIGIGPIEEAAYLPLVERFKQCRQRTRSRNQDRNVGKTPGAMRVLEGISISE
jgi:Domain of Unknown Function (DUF349)